MIDHGALGTLVLGLGSDRGARGGARPAAMADRDRAVGPPAPAAGAGQAGRHAARVISARLRVKPSPEFRYRDIGELAMVGRFRVVARLLLISFAGALAWLVWLGVHLLPEWLPESPAGQPALGLEPLHAHAGAG